MVKTDNRPSATAAKVSLRRRVLERMEPTRVLDAFCGNGAMYDAVWREAAEYTGIDERYEWPDARRRYVGDNRRILRAIDLGRFNIFDFDAYGSPWEQMLILAERRQWAPGERGAIVLTDGSSMKTRYGRLGRALATLVGQSTVPPSTKNDEWIGDVALRAWSKKAGVRVTAMWRAVSLAGATGGHKMVYSAALLEGQG